LSRGIEDACRVYTFSWKAGVQRAAALCTPAFQENV